VTTSYPRRVAAALAFCLCLVAVAWPVSGQRADQAGPAVSSDRLARIGQMIDRRIAAGEVPGTVTLVAQNGRVVHFEVRGVMDIETKRPLAKDAIFSLASLTKPVTTVAILMLVEEGKVRLSDAISKFIPAYADVKVAVTPARTVAVSRPVTIRDLLTHTSGFVSPAQIPTDANATLAEFIPRFASEPLEFQPGTQWTYSNTVAFDTLARIVELVSGETYDRFLRERIFEPLGMRDTAHALSAAQKSRLATRYDVTANGLRKAVRPETALVSDGLSWPVAMDLFLPQAWADDAARRATAGIPPTVRHEEKWRLALRHIRQVRAAGLAIDAVLGDAEYGKVPTFRTALDRMGLPYALGVPGHFPVWVRGAARMRPIAAIAATHRPSAWRRVRWATGMPRSRSSCPFVVKGWRLTSFAR